MFKPPTSHPVYGGIVRDYELLIKALRTDKQSLQTELDEVRELLCEALSELNSASDLNRCDYESQTTITEYLNRVGYWDKAQVEPKG